MPRIRKPHSAGAPSKLQSCFTLLLSGTSGECLAGELGCCGDSCCSSAVVSRALAEYCQHSDAAREAFTAAKGIDAMQVALTRGSAAVATAAARVLGALYGSSHGLRCVLQWQRSSSRDLMSLLANTAGRPGLPPELRVECIDALRAALASLHGPAAGGGMELARLLQVPPMTSEWTTAASAPPAAVSTGQHRPSKESCNTTGWADVASATSGDMLTSLALPTLLCTNLHLRAAAARLIATAADEGLLLTSGCGAGAVAASIAAALGLPAPCPGDRMCVTVESTQRGSRTAPFNGNILAEAVAVTGDDGPEHLGCGGRDGGAAAAAGAAGFVPPDAAAKAAAVPVVTAGMGLQQCRTMAPVVTAGRGLQQCRTMAAAASTAVAGEATGGGAPVCLGVRLLALCEVVVALLSGGRASWELLAALKGPEIVLRLCREADTQMGRRSAPHELPSTEPEGDTARKSVSAAEWEALLDALLLCLQEAPRKLWATVNDVDDAERQQAFAFGAADLAGELALVAMEEAAAAARACPGDGGEAQAGDEVEAGNEDGGVGSCGSSWRAAGGAATSLANSLAEWPKLVLLQPDVSPAVKQLLLRVCDLVGSLQRQYECEQGANRGRTVATASTEASPSPRVGPIVLGPCDTSGLPTASPPWFEAPLAPARASGHQGAAALRVLAEAAAAAVRLYGALYGRADPVPTDGEAAHVRKAGEPGGSSDAIGISAFSSRAGFETGSGNDAGSCLNSGSGGGGGAGSSRSGCSEEAAVQLARWLQRMATYVLDHPHDTGTGLGLLGPSLAALADGAPGAPLAALLAALGTCGDADRRSGLIRSLARAAAALAAALLASVTSGAQKGRESTLTCRGTGYRRPNVAWGGDLHGHGMPRYTDAFVLTRTTAAAAAGMPAAAGGGAFHYGVRPLPGASSPTPRPPEELGAEEHTALVFALRVWTSLMATNRMCTCAVVVRCSDPHGHMSEAGAGVGAAPEPSCLGCGVRFLVPLAEVTAAAERLWSLSGTTVDGAAQDAASGTVADEEKHYMRPQAGFRADGCSDWMRTALPTYGTGGAHRRLFDSQSCDSPGSSGVELHDAEAAGEAHLSSRWGLVLGALMNALAAASDLTHPSMCPGFGEALMKRMQRLVQAYSAAERCPVIPACSGPDPDDHRCFPETRSGAAPWGDEAGVEDVGGGAQSLAAEDLAEAEAILDDCLACVATLGSTV